MNEARESFERGNVALLMLAVIVLAGACCVGIARIGHAAALRARAENAADAAALAAADELALGNTDEVARAAAQRVAGANGATFLSCICVGGAAQVTVEVSSARARARAEVTTRAQDRTIRHDP
jgi:secretion/DNA translocation related TadE-like protein